jgi:hypothetical protein
MVVAYSRHYPHMYVELAKKTWRTSARTAETLIEILNELLLSTVSPWYSAVL